MHAIVDDADFDFLNQWKWHVSIEGKCAYASRNATVQEKINGSPSTIKMHRIILGSPTGCIIDHKDGNGLNNQKSNLRICSHAQNLMNTPTARNNTSGFKGVSFRKDVSKYEAYLHTKKQKIRLGLYLCPIEAAKAYDDAANKYFGEYARTNF